MTSFSAKDAQVRGLIAEAAAEWFVANREGLTAKGRLLFIEWLQESPAHVEEYLAHSVIAGNLRDACRYSEDALDQLLARARAEPRVLIPSSSSRFVLRSTATGWQPAMVVVTLCLLVGMGVLALRGFWPIRHDARSAVVVETQIATHHAEQLSRRLGDNSIVHLNTDTAVTIRYTDRERLVILGAGEVDFVVTHDAHRPFRVIAGATQIRDLGTRFDVLMGRDVTVVSVAEGRVAVSPRVAPTTPEGSIPEIPVAGGQQLTVVDGVWPPAKPVAVDAQRTTAWLHRQIVFDHAPLDKVAAEFNRYATKPIEIVTPGLQKLEISGVFTTDDPAAFIAFLRSLGSVRVEETPTQIRVSGNPK